MAVTVVLRLLPGPLRAGELVGEAELVASGVIEAVRSVDEIVAFVRRVAVDSRGAAAVDDTPDDEERLQ